MNRYYTVSETESNIRPYMAPVALMEKTLQQREKDWQEADDLVGKQIVAKTNIATRPLQGDYDLANSIKDNYNTKANDILAQYDYDIVKAQPKLSRLAQEIANDDDIKALTQAKGVYDATEKARQEKGRLVYTYNDYHKKELARNEEGKLEILQNKFEDENDIAGLIDKEMSKEKIGANSVEGLKNVFNTLKANGSEHVKNYNTADEWIDGIVATTHAADEKTFKPTNTPGYTRDQIWTRIKQSGKFSFNTEQAAALAEFMKINLKQNPTALRQLNIDKDKLIFQNPNMAPEDAEKEVFNRWNNMIDTKGQSIVSTNVVEPEAETMHIAGKQIGTNSPGGNTRAPRGDGEEKNEDYFLPTKGSNIVYSTVSNTYDFITKGAQELTVNPDEAFVNPTGTAEVINTMNIGNGIYRLFAYQSPFNPENKGLLASTNKNTKAGSKIDDPNVNESYHIRLDDNSPIGVEIANVYSQNVVSKTEGGQTISNTMFPYDVNGVPIVEPQLQEDGTYIVGTNKALISVQNYLRQKEKEATNEGDKLLYKQRADKLEKQISNTQRLAEENTELRLQMSGFNSKSAEYKKRKEAIDNVAQASGFKDGEEASRMEFVLNPEENDPFIRNVPNTKPSKQGASVTLNDARIAANKETAGADIAKVYQSMLAKTAYIKELYPNFNLSRFDGTILKNMDVFKNTALYKIQQLDSAYDVIISAVNSKENAITEGYLDALILGQVKANTGLTDNNMITNYSTNVREVLNGVLNLGINRFPTPSEVESHPIYQRAIAQAKAQGIMTPVPVEVYKNVENILMRQNSTLKKTFSEIKDKLNKTDVDLGNKDVKNATGDELTFNEKARKKAYEELAGNQFLNKDIKQKYNNAKNMIDNFAKSRRSIDNMSGITYPINVNPNVTSTSDGAADAKFNFENTNNSLFNDFKRKIHDGNLDTKTLTFTLNNGSNSTNRGNATPKNLLNTLSANLGISESEIVEQLIDPTNLVFQYQDGKGMVMRGGMNIQRLFDYFKKTKDSESKKIAKPMQMFKNYNGVTDEKELEKVLNEMSTQSIQLPVASVQKNANALRVEPSRLIAYGVEWDLAFTHQDLANQKPDGTWLLQALGDNYDQGYQYRIYAQAPYNSAVDKREDVLAAKNKGDIVEGENFFKVVRENKDGVVYGEPFYVKDKQIASKRYVSESLDAAEKEHLINNLLGDLPSSNTPAYKMYMQTASGLLGVDVKTREEIEAVRARLKGTSKITPIVSDDGSITLPKELETKYKGKPQLLASIKDKKAIYGTELASKNKIANLPSDWANVAPGEWQYNLCIENDNLEFIDIRNNTSANKTRNSEVSKALSLNVNGRNVFNPSSQQGIIMEKGLGDVVIKGLAEVSKEVNSSNLPDNFKKIFTNMGFTSSLRSPWGKTKDNKEAASLSEHHVGRAVDVSSMNMADYFNNSTSERNATIASNFKELEQVLKDKKIPIKILAHKGTGWHFHVEPLPEGSSPIIIYDDGGDHDD